VDIQVRPISPDEFESFARVSVDAFGATFRPEELDPFRVEAELGWSLAAFDGSTMVGTASAASFDLTVPGAVVPSVGVTAVGVLPTHRRRGILSALMRKQLDDFRDSGKPVAVLHASEAAIYPRFGYGLATLEGSLDIETQHSAFGSRLEPAGAVRLLDEPEALRTFPVLHERLRPEWPGFVSRSPEWWRHRFWIPEIHKRDYGDHFYALYEGETGPEGYAVYRRRHRWPDDTPADEIEVTELLATTDRGWAGMWRYLLDTDLVGIVHAYGRPLDEPLLYLVTEPRRLRLRVGDGLWLRLVDAAEALAARRYRAAGRLVMEIEDDLCPWNAGRVELEAGEEGAACRSSRADPDLLLKASDLAALYLGGISASALVRAGRIVEGVPGAALRADATFGWAPSPWCPEHF
jgi:predicted acetyltransferase